MLKSTAFTLEEINTLVGANSYQCFLLDLIKIKRSKAGHFSYADIARRSGFSARSFPREVALGRKKLTFTSTSKLITGLSLKGDWAEYFRNLVYLQYSEIRPPNQSDEKIRKRLKNLKARLLNAGSGKREGKELQLFINEHFPFIHAALGESDIGATSEEIESRTGFKAKRIHEALNYLIAHGIVEQKGERYFASNQTINLAQLLPNAFQSYFLAMAKRAEREAVLSFGSQEKLFLSSALSVSVSRLPELKKELRALISRFVEEAENPDGEKVVSLLCSLN